MLPSSQIDVKVKGKSGVHLTCTEGYIDCLKLLLDRGADAELMVGPRLHCEVVWFN